MISNDAPNGLRSLPWSKSPPPLLVEIQPNALHVKFGPLGRFDVGVDPPNVKDAGISPMQGHGKANKSMPMAVAISMMFLSCSPV